MSAGEALPLVLASGSPRRAAILRLLGLDPRILHPGDAERPHAPPEDPHAYAAGQARSKLRAGVIALGREGRGALVLAADTIVLLDDRVLGKPRDDAEALGMLQALAGRTHEVVTGVAVGYAGREAVGHETTRVTFRPVGNAELARYVASGEPLDKAGAYGIQDRGAALVRSVEGCFFNVMGLPVARLLDLLAAVGAQYDAGDGVVTAADDHAQRSGGARSAGEPRR